MRTVLILMDTLRRDALKCYNKDSEILTPNLNQFAEEHTIFNNHWIGSAPCMPARRDILCGRLNFLERSWGPIEPFDITLPSILKKYDIYSHITTDHCHYMRVGGEGYLQAFNTWDYHRGQEGDPWISRIDEPNNLPETFYGRVRNQYQWNRTMWESEEDMPSPKTFASACNFVEENKDSDNYFLMVEAFDPHEPFDVPQKYMDMYEEVSLDREYFEIPAYQRVSNTDVSPIAQKYIQKRYAALVTMTDHWFGKLITQLKETGNYEDTLIIVTTDHGYFLGERDYLGKNYMHLYNELAHLPLLVKYPNDVLAKKSINEVTQNIDIMPTVLDYYNIKIPSDVRGKSFKPKDNKVSGKEYALFGYHAMAANIYNGEHVYFKAPKKDNQPCFDYTAFPSTIRTTLGLAYPDEIEMGRYFERTKYPLFKIPTKKPGIIDQSINPLQEVSQSELYNLIEDYKQTMNIISNNLIEEQMKRLLVQALKDHDAPKEQFERLELL